MQPIIETDQLRNRQHAGSLLSQELADYRHDAVVVGIARGGVIVAAAIADELSLPLEVMLCRRIKHPADRERDLGCVSGDDVFLRNYSHTIPQDYIYHQIHLLKNAIAYEKGKYYGNVQPGSFRSRTVILVDDVLRSSDSMLACVRSIRKQKPLKVIVAIPVVSAEAARDIAAEADDVVFLKVVPSFESPGDYFVDFPRVDEREVKELLTAQKKIYNP